MASYQVPDYLLNALIKQESGGNNNAVSNKGARGITQVMPQTAANPGFGVTPLQSSDQEEYKRFTRDYMGAMLERYDGNLNKALAAYNAGPGAVDKAGGVPNYPETKNYVKKIISSLTPVNEAQAGEQPPPGKLSFEDWLAQRGQEPTSQQVQPAQQAEVPSGKLSFDDWLAQRENKPQEPLQAQPQESPQEKPSFFQKTISNIPSSAGMFLENTGQALFNLHDTSQGIMDLANGVMQKALPDSINQYMPESTRGNIKKANDVGEFYKNRYGGLENIKNTLSYDPVGVLADISTIAGGAGGLAKLGSANKLANIMSKVSTATNPMIIAGKGLGLVGKVAKGAGNVASTIVGNLGTHTGSESLRQAALSGLQGGAKAESFANNMRSIVPGSDIVDTMKSALQNMRANRGAAYREGMQSLGQLPQVIPFTTIDNAVSDALKIGDYKGVNVIKSAGDTQKKIVKIVDKWKQLPANEFHTAEGLDALKKAIGDIRGETQFGTSSRLIADKVYHAIKNEIVKNDPTYAKTMADYEKASELTKEIERALSIGDKASIDASMRKFLSLTRNNANTNFGNRIQLARELEQNGAPNLFSDISGQALNTWTPRGLGGVIASGTAGAGLATMSPLAIPALALQSPRLMGETAFALGKGGRLAKNITDNKLIQTISRSITPISSLQNMIQQ
jgi:hypothetical protein